MAITQNKDHSPERRARIHAVFAKSEYGRFNFRDSSAMVFCLHLSLFFFMAGFLIYFFNINHDTFYAVVWWVAIVTILYILYTVVPIFIPEELLFTPFSGLVFRVYISFPYAVSQVFSWIKPVRHFSIGARMANHYHDLQRRYSKGFTEGKTKSAERAASEKSRSIDTEVLEKILLTLDEDRALGEFFDAIPGFCDSNLVQNPLDEGIRANLQQSLAGFLDRAFSSTLVPQWVRSDRLITCLNAAHSALGPGAVAQILHNFFKGHSDEVLQSIRRRHYSSNKGNDNDDLIDPDVRRILAACIIACTQNRGNEWSMLVTDVLDVSEDDVQYYLYHEDGDGVLLAILMHVTREALRTGRLERGVLESLSLFDIRTTRPELQHEFYSLWEKIIEARNERASSVPTQILAAIRHLFTTLYPGTDAALAVSSGPIDHPTPS
jgi:hypothetical protein